MSGYLDTDIEVFHLRPLMLVELSWVGIQLPLKTADVYSA